MHVLKLVYEPSGSTVTWTFAISASDGLYPNALTILPSSDLGMMPVSVLSTIKNASLNSEKYEFYANV